MVVCVEGSIGCAVEYGDDDGDDIVDGGVC